MRRFLHACALQIAFEWHSRRAMRLLDRRQAALAQARDLSRRADDAHRRAFETHRRIGALRLDASCGDAP